jgi:hypothetical protein
VITVGSDLEIASSSGSVLIVEETTRKNGCPFFQPQNMPTTS